MQVEAAYDIMFLPVDLLLQPVMKRAFNYMNHPNSINQFWLKVEKTKTCWLWTSSIARGYGRFNYHGKEFKAHRFSWEINFGKIPKNLIVCHKCDVRNCVNPKHLFLGTQKDNIQDMLIKGRVNRKGNNAPSRKLTQKQVNKIRKLYNTHTAKELGKLFNVHWGHIYNIVGNKFWPTS